MSAGRHWSGHDHGGNDERIHQDQPPVRPLGRNDPNAFAVVPEEGRQIEFRDLLVEETHLTSDDDVAQLPVRDIASRLLKRLDVSRDWA